MRELKFRCWKMRNGKLQRYVCTPFGLFDYAHNHPDAPVMNYQNVNDIRDFMPDADVIDQYTGIKDKNGKEIYDGDIIHEKWYDSDVHRGRDRIGKIEYFCDGFVCWFKREGFVGLGMFPTKNIEIIGNIHENPELLEDEE